MTRNSIHASISSLSVRILVLWGLSLLLVPVVAWVANSAHSTKSTPGSKATTTWNELKPHYWPETNAQSEIVVSQFVRDMEIITAFVGISGSDMYVFERLDIGVPFRALRSTNSRIERLGLTTVVVDYTPLFHRGLRLGSANATLIAAARRTFPLRPLPIGYLANAIVYLLILEGAYRMFGKRNLARL